MANKINFEVGFTTNSQGLKQLKSELAEIRAMATDVNFSAGMDPSKIQAMVKSANDLEYAMNAAFDVDLNTVNIQKFNQILKQSGTDLNKIQQNLAQAGTVGQSAFLKATAGLMQFNTAAKQTNKFLDDIARSFANTVRWGIMSSIVNNISSTIQKSYYYVKDLDSALNDIRIVTGKNADEMSRFAEEANNAAKSLAVTTEDYTQGSLIYYQQGLDDETVKALTDITAKTSNVTGQSMSAVSEELTAVWNGYKVANEAAQEGMQVYEEYVDKMAAVGASTASDLQELSTAMSKVASAASSMGVDFDDLNAQIATIVSVTRQAPESVGTALKTIYARLGDLKVDGVDEFGTKLGEVTSQLQTMGIQILDQNGDMRAMSDVMAEVAEKWNTWTSAQRQAAAVAMAGKRQYNNLVALFDNWDMYGDALKVSMEAAGTLEEQQEIALDSLANKMDTLKATAEDLYDSLYDEEDIKDLIEGLTSIVQKLADFSDAIGGLKSLIPMLGSVALSVFNNQIANALSTVVINTKNAISTQNLLKQNYNELISMFSSSVLFGQNVEGLESVRQGAQQLFNYYNEMQKYAGIMSQDQKEVYNNILNNIEKVGSLNVEIEKTTQGWNRTKDSLHLIDIELINDREQVEKLASKVSEIENIGKELSDISELGEFKDVNSLMQKLSESIQGIEKTDSFKKVGDELTLLTKNGYDLDKALKYIIEKLKQTGSEGSNLVKLEQQVKILESSTKKAGDALKESLNIQKFISDITSGIGAMGQWTMAMKTLGDAFGSLKDNSISSLERFEKITMALSFSLPGLIKGFTQVASLIKAQAAASKLATIEETKNLAVSKAKEAFDKAKIAREAAELHIKKGWTKEQAEVVAKLSEEIAVTKIDTNEITKNTIQKQFNQKVSHTQAAAIKANVIALREETIAQAAQTDAIEAQTAAQEASNIAMMANPIGLVITAIAAVAAVIYGAVKAYSAYNKALKENAQAELDNLKRKEEELNLNEDLYQSYHKLKNEYNNGAENKDELNEATEQLCKAYDIEISKLDLLSEKYDKINNQINEKRKSELEEAKSTLQNEKATQGVVAFQTAREDRGHKIGNSYVASLYSQFDNNDQELRDALKSNLGEYFSGAGDLSIEYGNMDQLADAYHRVEQAAKDYVGEVGEETAIKSKSYKIVQDWLSKLRDQIKAYEELKEKIKNTDAELILNNHNFNNINSLEKYKSELNSITKELIKLGYSEEEAKEMAEIHAAAVSDSTKNYSLQLEMVKALAEETEKTEDKIISFINSLSAEEKEILFSGKIDIDNLKTLDNVKEAIKFVQGQVNKEDLSIITSLQAKIVSGEKLSKKEKEEKLYEESNLGSSYNSYMSDFENESQLDQTDITNEIIRDKIILSKEYIKTIEEQTKKQLELAKIQEEEARKDLKRIEGQKKALEYKAKYGTLTEQESAQLQTYNKIIEEYADKLASSTAAVEHYQEAIDSGFAYDEINNTVFDNLITGIDGVIREAEVLKNIADEVGENWTLAAGSIENFAKNFPDVFAMEENYQTLQDGRIQLTEQGKKALQEEIELQKNKLKLENDAYQEKLQQEAEVALATAEYYHDQANLLTEYLQGKRKGSEVEAKLEQGLSEYKSKLSEIEGLDSEELSRLIEENNNKVRQNTEQNLKADYDYWCTLGETIAAVAQAQVYGDFQPPKWIGGGGASGTDVSSYNRKSSGREQWIDNVSTEDIVAMRDAAEEQERIWQDRYANAVSKKTAAGARYNEAINSLDNASSGKGNDKSSSKSKSKKDYKDDEVDRYWEINKALEKVADALKKLDKLKSHVFGKQKIQVLEQEKKLIQEQTKLYEKLYEEQKKEAEELRGKLSAGGMTFSAEGEITNYGETLKNALASYNAAVDQFNAGLMDEEVFKVAEKNYENFKKNIDRYDKLFYTEMKETREKIEDELQKLRDINLEQIEIKLQVKIEKSQLKKEFRNFRKEMKKDFTLEYEVLPDTKDFRKNFKDDKKQVKDYMKDIKDVEKEIDIMMAGGTSKTYASISEAQERLKKLNKDFQEASKATMQDVEDAWDNYIALIDQANKKIEDQEKRLERVNDQLESFRQITELAFGPKAYEEYDRIFKQQLYNNQAQVESAIKESQTYQDLFKKQLEIEGASEADMTTWSEAITKYYEKWKDSEQKMYDLTADRIKLLKDDYLNTIDSIMNDLENQLTEIDTIDKDGNPIKISVGFDIAEEEWELAEKQADLFYNNTEKAYQIQTLNNKMQKDIDKSSLSNQKKIQAFRDKHLTELSNEKALTKYEVEAAQAKYDILLKQIALEDARNNKSTMKLRRNSEGNWSYQYVADEDDIKQKEQDILDSWENLRRISQEQFNDSTKELIKYQRLAAEAEAETERQRAEGLITKEQYEYKKKMIDDKYYNSETGIISILKKNHQKAQNDLILGEVGVRQEVYNQDTQNYNDFTDAEKETLDKFVDYTKGDFNSIETAVKNNYANIHTETVARMGEEGSTYTVWNTAAAKMADRWSNDKDGVRAIIQDSFKKMENATIAYQIEVNKSLEQVGLDVEGLKTKLTGLTTETDAAKTAITNYCTVSSNKLPKEAAAVQKLKNAWKNTAKQINQASQQLEAYLKKEGKLTDANKGVPALDNTDISESNTTETTSTNTSTVKTVPSGGSTTPPPISTPPKVVTSPVASSLTDNQIYDGPHKNEFHPIVTFTDGSKYYSQKYYKNKKDYPWMFQDISRWKGRSLKDITASGLKTGGYTGSWSGNDGRLAMLHQKELVLNAQDTENFLAATDSLRKLTSLDSSIERSIANAISKMLINMSMANNNIVPQNQESNNVNNTFNINAEFPNANDVTEIREAILSLPNLASQYINRQRI